MLQRPELDDIGEILLKASDLIEKRGHWKGGSRRAGGAVCIMYAIVESYDANLFTNAYGAEIIGRNKTINGAARRFVEHHKISWETKPDETFRSLAAMWNDTHSKEEVVAALRSAAYSPVIESKV